MGLSSINKGTLPLPLPFLTGYLWSDHPLLSVSYHSPESIVSINIAYKTPI